MIQSEKKKPGEEGREVRGFKNENKGEEVAAAFKTREIKGVAFDFVKVWKARQVRGIFFC